MTALMVQNAHVTTSYEGVTRDGHRVSLPPHLHGVLQRQAQVTMNYLDVGQLDRVIDELVFGKVSTHMANWLGSMPETDAFGFVAKVGLEVDQLRRALYATRYHQRQFLYRWNLLRPKFALLPARLPAPGTAVVLDDMPLRFEFQAFVTAADAAALDVLWRVVCVVVGKSPKQHQDFRIKVEKTGDRFPALHGVAQQYRDWNKDLRTMRNVVAHRGALEDFQGFGVRGGDLLQPSVGPVSAAHLGIRLWQQLHQVVDETVQAATTDAAAQGPKHPA